MTEIHLPALLSDTFGGSRSEARRVLAQGGVKLNGSPLSLTLDLDMEPEDLNGELMYGNRRRVYVVDGEVKAGA